MSVLNLLNRETALLAIKGYADDGEDADEGGHVEEQDDRMMLMMTTMTSLMMMRMKITLCQ